MRSGGWKPFWAALFASLLVLVPLVGGTVLLSRQQLRTQLRQAARSESGVPIQLPKTTDQLTVLLCVSGEQPGFVLAYLNASQNCVHLLSVPAVLTVPFAEEETSLARCYAAAGPARCREALAQVLALPEGTRYLAFSPDVLERIASRYGPVRVGFTGALTEEELARYGRSRAVQGISAGDAHEFLCQLQADEAFSPVRTAAARAAVWDAFLRQVVLVSPIDESVCDVGKITKVLNRVFYLKTMDCEGKWDNVYDNCLLSEIVSFSIDTDYVKSLLIYSLKFEK